MNNCVDDIRKMTLSGVKVNKIIEWTGLKPSEVRKIMLENVIYPCKNDKEYGYFKDALLLKKHEKHARFYNDLSKMTGICSPRLGFLTELYGIKPRKKAFCEVCGKEITASRNKRVSKYCSKECSYKKHNPKKERKPIIKTCLHCGNTFEGKPNSKFCSDLCKKMYKEVEATVEWLKG